MAVLCGLRLQRMPPALRAAPNFGGKKFAGVMLSNATPGRAISPNNGFSPQRATMPPALRAAPNFGGCYFPEFRGTDLLERELGAAFQRRGRALAKLPSSYLKILN